MTHVIRTVTRVAAGGPPLMSAQDGQVSFRPTALARGAPPRTLWS